MQNSKEQFNTPKIVVDLEQHKRNKENKEKKEEVESLRGEIERIKEKTTERHEQNRESYFFIGPEIFEVEPSSLTEEDLLVYRDLKNFKKGKMPLDDFFKTISKHRWKVAEYSTWIREIKPNYDFGKDSRCQFLAWMQNKFIEEEVRKKMKEAKG